VFVVPLQQQFFAPVYRSFHFINFSHYGAYAAPFHTALQQHNFIWRFCSTISYGASAAPFHIEPLNLTKIKPYRGKILEAYGSLQNQPQSHSKLAQKSNFGTILPPPSRGQAPLQNQDNPSCHMSTCLP
jgi:hypothetical protein